MQRLKASGISVRCCDTSQGNPTLRILPSARRLARILIAFRLLARQHLTVYVSLNAGLGMYISALQCAVARMRGNRLIVHHHTYHHLYQKRLSAALLVRAAGSGALHVLLGEEMGAALAELYPRALRRTVLNNSGLIDERLTLIPFSVGGGTVLGHLSNLTLQKGIREVVDLALRISDLDPTVSLVVAGPASDIGAEQAIAMAAARLNHRFKYLGAVDSDQKLEFFEGITHFVFPSHYKNEASPLVLLEAMASGRPSLATRVGCVHEMLTGAGHVFENPRSLVAEGPTVISEPYDRWAVSARDRYLELRDEHRRQYEALLHEFE